MFFPRFTVQCARCVYGCVYGCVCVGGGCVTNKTYEARKDPKIDVRGANRAWLNVTFEGESFVRNLVNDTTLSWFVFELKMKTDILMNYPAVKHEQNSW